MNFIFAFERLQAIIHATAVDKGWWDERERALHILEQNGMGAFAKQLIDSQCILLQHCELSEGVEGMRNGLMDDKCPQYPMVVVEQADNIIRAMDMACNNGWPLAQAIVDKVRMNKGRSYKHGGKAF